MIRIDAIWLALGASDLRAGMDTLLARVVRSFEGGAQAHNAYVFANRSASRLKVLIPFLHHPCTLSASLAVRLYCRRFAFAFTNDVEIESSTTQQACGYALGACKAGALSGPKIRQAPSASAPPNGSGSLRVPLGKNSMRHAASLWCK
jgi:hypothetical protein